MRKGLLSSVATALVGAGSAFAQNPYYLPTDGQAGAMPTLLSAEPIQAPATGRSARVKRWIDGAGSGNRLPADRRCRIAAPLRRRELHVDLGQERYKPRPIGDRGAFGRHAVWPGVHHRYWQDTSYNGQSGSSQRRNVAGF